MPLVNHVVLALAFSLKREAHYALSHFESSNPRRETCMSPSLTTMGSGRIHLLDHTVSITTLSLERGRRSLQTVLPRLETPSLRRNS